MIWSTTRSRRINRDALLTHSHVLGPELIVNVRWIRYRRVYHSHYRMRNQGCQYHIRPQHRFISLGRLSHLVIGTEAMD